MQRGGSAACRLREFGDMDLDATVQEVEAESKHTVEGDENRTRERIENTTHRERGDQQSGDRRTGLANGKKQQGHVREKPMDEHCFEEHGCEADLGAWVGKNAAEIGHYCRAVETRRRLRHHAAEGE